MGSPRGATRLYGQAVKEEKKFLQTINTNNQKIIANNQTIIANNPIIANNQTINTKNPTRSPFPTQSIFAP